MLEPCFELCYMRYGKQYSEECYSTCRYAKGIKDRDKVINWLLDLLEDEHMGMRDDLIKTIKDTFGIEA